MFLWLYTQINQINTDSSSLFIINNKKARKFNDSYKTIKQRFKMGVTRRFCNHRNKISAKNTTFAT